MSSTDGNAGDEATKTAAYRSFAIAFGVAASSAAVFATLLWHLPPLEASDLQTLKRFPPQRLEQLIAQRDVLLNYTQTFPGLVTLCFCFLYVLMQTFAIPGTVWLTVLSVINVCGSLSCYSMSLLMGKPIVEAIWPDRLAQYGKEVQRRKAELLNYIVFLRVTPILPNVFINVASPIVGVPILPFSLGTFVGCMPNNFVFVNAGSRLGELRSLSDLYDIQLLLIGCGVGVVALLPVLWRHVHTKKAAQLQASCKKS